MKKIRRRSHSFRRQRWQQGFTLVEVLVIVAVMGIVGVIALPAFASMMEGMKVNQSVSELQIALQDTQRQAIRKSQACTIQVSPSSNSGHGHPPSTPSIAGNCLTSGSPKLPSGIKFATNLKPVDTLTPNVSIQYGTQGSAEFSILSAVQPPLLPADPTGKIVTFVENPKVEKKCVAVSSTLGLTRMGIYKGSITPAAITDTGICTAMDWTKQ